MTASVDKTVKLAVMMLAAHWYEHREPVTMAGKTALLPIGIESLLDSWEMTNVSSPYRLTGFERDFLAAQFIPRFAVGMIDESVPHLLRR